MDYRVTMVDGKLGLVIMSGAPVNGVGLLALIKQFTGLDGPERTAYLDKVEATGFAEHNGKALGDEREYIFVTRKAKPGE